MQAPLAVTLTFEKQNSQQTCGENCKSSGDYIAKHTSISLDGSPSINTTCYESVRTSGSGSTSSGKREQDARVQSVVRHAKPFALSSQPHTEFCERSSASRGTETPTEESVQKVRPSVARQIQPEQRFSPSAAISLLVLPGEAAAEISHQFFPFAHPGIVAVDFRLSQPMNSCKRGMRSTGATSSPSLRRLCTRLACLPMLLRLCPRRVLR